MLGTNYIASTHWGSDGDGDEDGDGDDRDGD